MNAQRLLVIGGGIAGLNAAYQAARRGARVTVVEPRGRCGGLVCGAPVGGVMVDLGAESYARRSAYTTDLIGELGLEVVTPGGSSWIWSHGAGPRLRSAAVNRSVSEPDTNRSASEPDTNRSVSEASGAPNRSVSERSESKRDDAGPRLRSAAVDRSVSEPDTNRSVSEASGAPDRSVSERSESKRGHAYPIPAGVLGIPADVRAPDVVAALGPDAARRAAQDLTLGPDVGADIPDVAGFVTARMGADVVRRFVAPIAGGVHSTDPAKLAVDSIAPGLRERMRELGSLTAAVGAQRAAAPAGSVVAAVKGGMFRLPAALADAVVARGGEIRTRTVCTGLRRDGAGWEARLAPALPGATPADDPVPGPDATAERFDAVVLATGGRVAMTLLADLPELADATWDLPTGADLAGATLALDAPALDAAPRGSGLLVALPEPGEIPTVQAKALTHYSVKWGWVREGQPLHILRLSYGRDGQPRPTPTPADALADASTLLGVELREDQLRGCIVAHWNDSLPPHTPAHREHLAALRPRVEALPGFGIVGAWYAGTGLAAVLPQAEQTAERMLS